jgi:plastocyanin
MHKTILTLGVIASLFSGCTAIRNSVNPSPQPIMEVASPSAQLTGAVTIKNMVFSPTDFHIKVGGTITITNLDTVSHTLTSKEKGEGAFDSGPIKAGGTTSVTFTKAGTYEFVCSFHPNMKGTVVVEPITEPTP